VHQINAGTLKQIRVINYIRKEVGDDRINNRFYISLYHLGMDEI